MSGPPPPYPGGPAYPIDNKGVPPPVQYPPPGPPPPGYPAHPGYPQQTGQPYGVPGQPMYGQGIVVPPLTVVRQHSPMVSKTLSL